MFLPNSERAFVDLLKLADYCLDSTHPVGQFKSRVFFRALGFTKRDAENLRKLLLQAAKTHQAMTQSADEFGQRYTVDFEISSSIGSAQIRSAWIVRKGEDFPRLVTCFVLPH